ncbi:diphthine synthase [Candidatus Woesearchaeota archaeon]|nr:diphthine synthase [Candidatus Woesearchaeota archaeon]
MTLYFIGLGLNNEKDITLKGLEAIKSCNKIYLESYTSKLQCSKESLEKLYGKDIILADRDMVEKQAESTILKDAKTQDTAFLVIGDPFGATTHTDLMLRAKELKIETKVINNTSILNAIGIMGLELYKFGRTVSIPFDEKANSFYDFFKKNQSIGLHTLFLLDLNPINNRFLTIKEAIQRLLKLGLKEDQLCIACSALGSEKKEIIARTAEQIKDIELKHTPQCLIIPGNLHFVEEDALKQWQ